MCCSILEGENAEWKPEAGHFVVCFCCCLTGCLQSLMMSADHSSHEKIKKQCHVVTATARDEDVVDRWLG